VRHGLGIFARLNIRDKKPKYLKYIPLVKDYLKNDILQIVDKFICDLQVQLDKKQVSLELSSDARQWLAEKGYDHAMGARPMARVIQEHLKKPLANEILFGALVAGGEVKVSLQDNALQFEYQSAKAMINA
jgi:ATP-dependent Clp protease ATP-binding subunit ClpA